MTYDNERSQIQEKKDELDLITLQKERNQRLTKEEKGF